jgi:hypothetical protein
MALDPKRVLSGTFRSSDRYHKCLTETPLNDNCIAVIRESHVAQLSRKELAVERRRILELDETTDSRIWNKIKRRNQMRSLKSRTSNAPSELHPTEIV